MNRSSTSLLLTVLLLNGADLKLLNVPVMALNRLTPPPKVEIQKIESFCLTMAVASLSDKLLDILPS